MEFPNKFVLKCTEEGKKVALSVNHVVEFDGEHYNIKYLGDVFPYTGDVIQSWIGYGWYTLEAI